MEMKHSKYLLQRGFKPSNEIFLKIEVLGNGLRWWGNQEMNSFGGILLLLGWGERVGNRVLGSPGWGSWRGRNKARQPDSEELPETESKERMPCILPNFSPSPGLSLAKKQLRAS